MWSEEYESAAAHFTAATRGENDFAFARVAEWQLGNFPVTTQRWREGRKAQYAVGCRVCSMTARFLILVSALEADLFSKEQAEIAVSEAVNRVAPSRWSGVVGRYLLGQTEDSELERWIDTRHQDVEVFECRCFGKLISIVRSGN